MFEDVDFPYDWDAKRAHLIERLLSPSILIILLNELIVSEISI